MGDTTITGVLVAAVPADDVQQLVFVFLHGLASTEADLRPLALEFERSGHSVELLRLPIHQDRIEQLTLDGLDSAATWLRPRLETYGTRPVYLVGFSTGAAVALLYAREYPVAGVVGISTFLGPRKRLAARYLLPIAGLFPRLRLPRRPHTTTRKTRNELQLRGSLSIRARQIAIRIGRQASDALDAVTCPVLLFHSLDDSVADYAPVGTIRRRLPPDRTRLISFRQLDHFMQFDIPPFTLCMFILHYFGVARKELGQTPASPKPEDMLKVYADERRHWTLVLFQVIAGAFTIFALLLYNTLGDVVNKSDKTPYYLLSYSMVSSVYVVLSTLYFFYANRVDAYIRLNVEPLLPGVSWSSFRTNPFISGRGSPNATRLAAVPLFVVPYIISIGTVVTVFLQYKTRIMDWTLDLTVPFILCLLMSLLAIFFSLRHSDFARTYLQRIPVPLNTDPATETLLHALYTSVSPGCVNVVR